VNVEFDFPATVGISRGTARCRAYGMQRPRLISGITWRESGFDPHRTLLSLEVQDSVELVAYMQIVLKTIGLQNPIASPQGDAA